MLKEIAITKKTSDHELLDFIIQSSTEYAIIGTEMDGQIFLWNTGAQRMYGYSEEEILGKTKSSILYPVDEPASIRPAQIMDAIFYERKWEGTLTHIRKNGEHFPARITITPRLGANNTPLGFLIISKDMSHEVHLADELSATRIYTQTLEEKFNGLLEAAPDALVIVDDNGVILMVNAQTESLFGYDRNTLTGKSVEILVPERFKHIHPTHRKIFSEEPQQRPMGIGLELHGLRADGREFPWRSASVHCKQRKAR